MNLRQCANAPACACLHVFHEQEFIQKQVPRYKPYKTDMIATPGLCGTPARDILQPLLDAEALKPNTFSQPVVRAFIYHRWACFASFYLTLQLIDRCAYIALFLVYSFSLQHKPPSDPVPGEACTKATASQLGMLGALLTMTCSLLFTEAIQATRRGVLNWVSDAWNLADVVVITLMGTIAALHISCTPDGRGASVEWLGCLAGCQVRRYGQQALQSLTCHPW